jgi:hypothetical protein
VDRTVGVVVVVVVAEKDIEYELKDTPSISENYFNFFLRPHH